jgi:Ca2+:H+ antiporter
VVRRRAWWALLILGPIASLGNRAGWDATLVFVLAALGTIPGAVLLGQATEEVASGITLWDAARRGTRRAGTDVLSFGGKVGGLLNATFGNVPELIIAGLAIQQGYLALAKATIIGSVVGNAALVLGCALLVGGVRNGVQHFDAGEAGHHAVLLALSVASLVLPSLFLTQTHSRRITEISVVAALVLLVVYGGYLAYSIFQVQPSPDDATPTFIEDEARAVQELSGLRERWPLSISIAVLGLATIVVFTAAEALVRTVEPFTHKLGWSPVFIGVIIVPLIGNVAEHSSAIVLAWKNKMDVALGVSSGSSIQVAVFVAPVLVLLSQFGHRLDLAFSSLEIATLGLVVALFYLVSRDGESNWLEGLQLIGLYALAATVFFYVPGQLR